MLDLRGAYVSIHAFNSLIECIDTAWLPRKLPFRHRLNTDDLLTDERWQLVQRIISSPPFPKGTRLRDLLQYVTEQTIAAMPTN